jgi:hypothetical protein
VRRRFDAALQGIHRRSKVGIELRNPKTGQWLKADLDSLFLYQGFAFTYFMYNICSLLRPEVYSQLHKAPSAIAKD